MDASTPPPLAQKRPWVLPLVALVLFACGVFCAIPSIVTILPSSLIWDEMASIDRYSGEGANTSFSSYQSSNNHRLFNILNSFMIDERRVVPLKARALSFGFLLISLGLPVLLWRLGKRPPYLLWGVAGLAILLSPRFLELHLWARGYGMVWMAVMAAGIGVIGWFESRKWWWLVLLGLAGVVGTFTVPSAVLLFAPLLLGLWIADRFSRATLYCMIFSGLASFAVWLPVLREVIEFAGEAEERWGRPYGELGAVAEVLDSYLLPLLPGFLQWGLFACALAIPFIPNLCSPQIRKALFVCLAAALVAHVMALMLGTPFRRNLVMANVPIVLSLGIGLDALFRRISAVWMGGLTALIAAGVLLWVYPRQRAAAESFEPEDNIFGVVSLINELRPHGTRIYVSPKTYEFIYPQQIRWEGWESLYPFEDAFDQAAFDAGEMLVIDADGDSRWYREHGIQAWVPQQVNGLVQVWEGIPRRLGITRVGASFNDDGAARLLQTLPESVWETSPENGAVLEIDLDHPQEQKTLYLACSRPAKVAPLKAVTVGGIEVKWRFAGNLLLIPLTGEGSRVALEFVPQEEGELPFGICSAWVR